MPVDEPRTSRATAMAALVARYALVIVLAWFGSMKFTYYESHGISPLVFNSPFESWIYDVISIRTFGRLLGTLELITAVLIAIKPWIPKAAVLGGVMSSLFFVNTLSFMITTPGVGEETAGGFPVLSANGQFLMKDIALFGLSLWLLADAVEATRGRAKAATKAAFGATRIPDH